jgi:mediator of RNA polymerase II transcription subunit 12
MADMAQGAKADFGDEIERLLYSGTSMDTQVMGQVFQRIADWMRGDLQSLLQQGPMFGAWFLRLRSFDDRTFDSLAHEWISQLLRAVNIGFLQEVLVILANAGCLSLVSFFNISERSLRETEEDDNTSARVAHAVLELLLPVQRSLSQDQAQYYYRYRIMQQRFCEEHQSKVVDIALTYVKHCSRMDPSPACSRAHILADERPSAFLRKAVLQNSLDVLNKVLNLDIPSAVVTSLLQHVYMGYHQPSDVQKPDVRNQVRNCIRYANEFSVPFRTLELRLALNTARQSSDGISETIIGLVLFEAIEDALSARSWVWTEVIENLEPGLLARVRERAELRVLSVPDVRQSTELRAHYIDSMERHIAIVDSTAISIPNDGLPEIASALTERLRKSILMLDEIDIAAGNDANDVMPIPIVWLQSLLRLVLTHQRSFQIDKAQTLNQMQIFQILSVIITHPSLHAFPSLTQLAFDIAAIFSDELSDDMRQELTKVVFTRPADCRLSFLFGPFAHPDAWLGTVSACTTFTNSSQSRPSGQLPAGRPQFHTGTHSHMAARVPAHIQPQQQRQQQGGQKQAQQVARPLQGPLRRWEILPDPTSNAMGNDTALSLGLFGARKV